MKRTLAVKKPSILTVALLALTVTTTARADQKTCSNVSAAGKWAFTSTGSLILPTGAVQVAAVATFTQDAAGNVSGTQTRTLGGSVADETFTGTVTVNSDCTSTYIVDVFASGVLVRTTTARVIFDDNLRSARGIFTSLVLPNAVTLPTVITIDARKLFPKED